MIEFGGALHVASVMLPMLAQVPCAVKMADAGAEIGWEDLRQEVSKSLRDRLLGQLDDEEARLMERLQNVQSRRESLKRKSGATDDDGSKKVGKVDTGAVHPAAEMEVTKAVVAENPGQEMEKPSHAADEDGAKKVVKGEADAVHPTVKETKAVVADINKAANAEKKSDHETEKEKDPMTSHISASA
jgi:hypothetical protein